VRVPPGAGELELQTLVLAHRERRGQRKQVDPLLAAGVAPRHVHATVERPVAGGPVGPHDLREVDLVVVLELDREGREER
jgi:hypothetical protein